MNFRIVRRSFSNSQSITKSSSRIIILGLFLVMEVCTLLFQVKRV